MKYNIFLSSGLESFRWHKMDQIDFEEKYLQSKPVLFVKVEFSFLSCSL